MTNARHSGLWIVLTFAISAAAVFGQEMLPEAKVLTERFGAAQAYELDADEQKCLLDEPQAADLLGRFTAKEWTVDDARQVVLYERDGRAQALWFLADAVRPDEVQSTAYPGADEVGWLETDIHTTLHDLGWDHLIGKRIGCDGVVIVYTSRGHRQQYFDHGLADVTETNLDFSNDAGDCVCPSYHRFFISRVEVRSSTISGLVPPSDSAQKQLETDDSPDWLSSFLADMKAEIAAAPRVLVDGYNMRVSESEYSQLRVGDHVQYGVDVCGRLLGIWPPRDLSHASP